MNIFLRDFSASSGKRITGEKTKGILEEEETQWQKQNGRAWCIVYTTIELKSRNTIIHYPLSLLCTKKCDFSYFPGFVICMRLL